MRIISSFKDYYDYIAHQNVDNKIVYNRQCQAFTSTRQRLFNLIGQHDPIVVDGLEFPRNYYELDSLHFCGRRYFFIASNGYVTYDLDEIFELLLAREKAAGRHLLDFRDRQRFLADYLVSPSTLNRDLNAPVVLVSRSGVIERNTYLTNVSLKSIEFVKLYAPEQAFMAIYNFLTPAEITPDSNPDNMTRYEAKGFDRKISFRKRKGD